MSKEKVLNILKYTKTSGQAYSGQHKNIGYHSIVLDNEYYKGQRDCIKRLSFIENEIDIENTTILDIGCCTGGMLYPVSKKIKKGIGLDFNYKNINACNRITDYQQINNLGFYVFDLEKEKLEDINNFFDESIDIVFLFSVCMWINNWKELIKYIHKNSNILVIETNGNNNQQLEQYNYINSKYKTVKKLYDKSDDDETQKNRKLYICKKN